MINRDINDERIYLSPTVFRAVADLWNFCGKTSTIPVSGRSMLPAIKPGDRLVVSHHIGQLHLGDIITFYDKRILVVHRIMRTTNQLGCISVTTKGDNSRAYDNPIAYNDILGRVVAIERNGDTLSLDRLSIRIKGWLIAIRSICMSKAQAFFILKNRSLFTRIKRRLSALFDGVTI